MIISNGEVEILAKYDGNEYVVDTLGPGSVMGAYRILGQMPYVMYAKAKTSVTL
jgi:CRP-like cAMP-binding protein